MSWALTEDWLNVAGLSLLTIGTGAQAVGALTEYTAILKTEPDDLRNTLLGPLDCRVHFLWQRAFRSLPFRHKEAASGQRRAPAANGLLSADWVAVGRSQAGQVQALGVPCGLVPGHFPAGAAATVG